VVVVAHSWDWFSASVNKLAPTHRFVPISEEREVDNSALRDILDKLEAIDESSPLDSSLKNDAKKIVKIPGLLDAEISSTDSLNIASMARKIGNHHAAMAHYERAHSQALEHGDNQVMSAAKLGMELTKEEYGGNLEAQPTPEKNRKMEWFKDTITQTATNTVIKIVASVVAAVVAPIVLFKLLG
jgi:hypothetical protein